MAETLRTDLLAVASDTAHERGTVPVYNDFGAGGVPIADYFRPAAERSRSDLAAARATLLG